MDRITHQESAFTEDFSFTVTHNIGRSPAFIHMPRRRRLPHARSAAQRRAKCNRFAGAHALCFHHCLLFGDDPYPWLCAPASRPPAAQGAFESHFAAIAGLVGGLADTRRLQSIAAWHNQTDYYSSVVRSTPTIKTACEIGFNAGHSAAVLLSSSPVLTLESFDLLSLPHSEATLRYIQRQFPSRVHAHKGDSALTVPNARLRSPCDLVLVDGRHQFQAVIRDVINLQRHASPDALYLVDDVCDRRRCESWNEGGAVHFGGPTLAVCELIRSGLMVMVDSAFGGVRQWVLLRAAANSTARFAEIAAKKVRARSQGGAAPEVVLPCHPAGTTPPRCKVRWTRHLSQRTWNGLDGSPFGKRERSDQQRMTQACSDGQPIED